MSNLLTQDYWDSIYENYNLKSLDKNNEIIKWLEIFFKEGNLSCFEIGCYPGHFLDFFGKLGYILNGIDKTKYIKKRLLPWLEGNLFKIGDFFEDDFLNFNTEKTYDLVCSFGFIEHFLNWKIILEKHTKFVKPNGILVIETPNFSGFIQRKMHTFLDKENFDRHNIESMNPELWADILKKLGFKILFCGYFGSFDFWIESKNINLKKKILIVFIMLIKKFLRFLLNNKNYSPYCGIIA